MEKGVAGKWIKTAAYAVASHARGCISMMSSMTEEAAKTRGEQEAPWWRARLVAAAVLVAGAVVIWFLFLTASGLQPSEQSDEAGWSTNEQRAPRLGGPVGSSARTLADVVRLDTDFRRASALYALVEAMERDDLDGLLDDADRLQGMPEIKPEIEKAKRIIYSRYAELDPKAAVDRVLSRQGDGSLLLQVFGSWVETDLAAALRRMDDLPPRHRRDVARMVLAWSQPADRGRVAERFGLENELLRMETEEHLHTDPAAAWRQALAAPSSKHRERMLAQVAHAWTAKRPRAAMDAIQALAASPTRDALARACVTQWAAVDAAAAKDWVLTHPSSIGRAVLVEGLARGMAQRSPEEALGFARMLEDGEKRAAIDAVFSVWAISDPAMAAQQIESLGERSVSRQTLQSLMDSWAKSDPHAALAWGKSRDGLFNLLTGPLQGVARSEPMTALKLAGDLPVAQRQNGFWTVLRTWAQSDPRAAAAWIDQSNAELGEFAVASVVYQLARVHFDEAWEWLERQKEPQRRRGILELISRATTLNEATDILERVDDRTLREATREFTRAWVMKDPEGATQWVVRSQENILPFFYDWTLLDPKAAAARARRLDRQSDRDWASAAVIGAATDLAASGMSDFIAESSYKDIRDAKAKRFAARSLHRYWAKKDPDRAEKYLRDAGLGPPVGG